MTACRFPPRRFVVASAVALFAAGCDRDRMPAKAAASVAFETPAPAGPYGVGFTERDGKWLIYYPAEKAVTVSQIAPALPAGHVENLTRRFGPEVAAALAAGRGQAAPRAHAAYGRWPVMIFAPGWRLTAWDYRSLLEDIASRGYIVIAMGTLPESAKPPYSETAKLFSEGRKLAVRMAGDFTDPVRDAIDVEHVVACGHSAGGAAAVLALNDDPGLLAAINLDGDYGDAALRARPRRPVLYLLGQDMEEPAASVARRLHDWQEVSRASSAPYAFQVKGFRHLNFLDAALLAGQMPLDKRSGGFGYFIPASGLRLTADLVTGFGDEYCRGQAGTFAAARGRWPDAMPFGEN